VPLSSQISSEPGTWDLHTFTERRISRDAGKKGGRWCDWASVQGLRKVAVSGKGVKTFPAEKTGCTKARNKMKLN